MNKIACCILFLIPLYLWAQERTFVGLNLAPLLINTVDIQAERQLSPVFNLQLAAGFRVQRVGLENTPRVSLLQNYINVANDGLFLSVGGRLFNDSANPYEYPYIALNLNTNWYRDRVYQDQLPNPAIESYQGWKLGGTFTLGFVIYVMKRVYVDLGLQLAYSPMREDMLSYYLGGMGYTTFGANRFSLEGAHFQPVITLKYEIVQDRRARLREKE
ncbi:MAG: hypothetical protein AAFQ87_01650 [Bacteroidota bacterium]